MTRLRTSLPLLILALLPAAMPLVLIAQFGVNFAVWDEWDPGIAGLYVKAHHNQFQIGDLFAFHNEHRIAIPRLIFVAFNLLTHWNCIVLMLLSWTMVMATSIMMLRLMAKSVGDFDNSASMLQPRVLLLWFLVNLSMFSLTQWENWLWGMGVQNFMPMMWIAAGLLVIFRPQVKWRHTGAIVLLATLATYSSGNGLLAWPMLGGMLAWSGSWMEFRSKRWKIAAFAAAGLLVCILYFHGFNSRPSDSSTPHTLNPIEISKFVGIFLGAGLSAGIAWAPYAAAYVATCLMLVLTLNSVMQLAWLFRQAGTEALRHRMALWLCIASFGLLSAVMAGLGRAGTGTIAGFSSRYATFALYLHVALIPLIAIVSSDWRERWASKKFGIWLTRLGWALGVSLVVLQFLSIPNCLDAASIIQGTRRQAKIGIFFSRLVPSNLWLEQHVFPRPAQILPMVNDLEEMKMIQKRADSLDARRLVPPASEPLNVKGQIDATVSGADGMLTTYGWATLEDRKSTADAVALSYDTPTGEPILFAFARTNLKRDDVAAALKSRALEYAGWDVTYSFDAFPPDLKGIRVRAWAVDADRMAIAPLLGTWEINR